MSVKSAKNKVNQKRNRVVKLFENKRRAEKNKEVVNRLKAEISKIPERSMVDTSHIKRFLDLPLSKKTLLGLNEAGYEQPTEIQKEALPLALRGLDILGAAKTGSGKTLAFLIPVIELLYRNEWSKFDGVGALIITPVRELAYQIFEVLRKIGKKHDFSAGLIIGGKDRQFEKSRINKCNIIICTPGRLLDHFDCNPLFDCTYLKILVLDEADKILEMGFADTLNSIIENLPVERQTLLFSATQTKSVKDLARLSLKDPAYVSVHENSKNSTPDGLIQSYIVCEIEDKFNLLWSFIKEHLKKKILVFMSSCKQVKFTYEALCKLRPGMSVLCLNGTMHQERRMEVYNQFRDKRSAVLIATDIAARGLDFPAVNWVIQLDCPEDATTYIHRAGRTARFEKDGQALLVLLPSEEIMASHIIERRIPLSQIKVNNKKQLNVQKKLEMMLAQNSELKESAQRAFKAYFKSVFLMKDKSVFDVTKLNKEGYARSLGLINAPRIRFLQKHGKLSKTASSEKTEQKSSEIASEDDESDEGVDDELGKDKPKWKVDTQAYNFGYDIDSDDDESLFTVKQRFIPTKSDPAENKVESIDNKNNKSLEKPVTKAVIAKKILKKNIKAGTKIVFDDDGEAVDDVMKRPVSELAKSQDLMGESGIDIATVKSIMKEEDKIDKETYRQRQKAARKAKKLLEKEKMRKRKKQQEEDYMENDGEDDWSSGDENSVNLDFLPDPDKVYKNNRVECEDDSNDDNSEEENSGSESEVNDSEEENESSDEEVEELPKKRKRRNEMFQANKKKAHKINTACENIGLQDAEMLALKLLETKRF